MLSMWRLKLLVQFHTLGTMQRVSEAMHTSIATVSQQLNLLEQETEMILFEKVGRNVQLTPEGCALAEKARPILNQLDILESSLKDDISTEIKGTIRIASFTSALKSIVIPAVSILSKRYTQLDIRLIEMEPDKSIPALDAFQLDLAVVAYSDKPHLLEQQHRKVIKLGTDCLMALVGKQHPLAKHKKKLPIALLKDEYWVSEREGTFLSEYTRTLCRQAGFEPNVTNIMQSYQSMHDMIAENLVVGVLPELAVIKSRKEIQPLMLVPKATRDVYLVTRKNALSSRAMQAITEVIARQSEEVFRNLSR